MRYAYQPSFLQTAGHLSKNQANKLLRAIDKFQQTMESRHGSQGLGITHLRESYFEFRIDIHTRVIYRRSGNLIQYVLYRNHDQVSAS